MCQKSLVDLTDFRVLHMFYSNTVMTYPKTHFCGKSLRPEPRPSMPPTSPSSQSKLAFRSGCSPQTGQAITCSNLRMKYFKQTSNISLFGGNIRLSLTNTAFKIFKKSNSSLLSPGRCSARWRRSSSWRRWCFEGGCLWRRRPVDGNRPRPLRELALSNI